MGILHDDVVIISQPEKEGDPTIITVNCPDKTGLGCDLCRIILLFGLSIVRGDVTTDGRWCYIVFWVVGGAETKWDLLSKRLLGVCPSWYSASGISYYSSEFQEPKPADVFLLKLCCHDRRGLLHDVTWVLSELELAIKRVKVSTTPDGRVVDLFFVTDTRELLHTRDRQEETWICLKEVLGKDMISCDIEVVVPEVTICSQAYSFLPPVIAEDMFQLEMPDEPPIRTDPADHVSITMDNSLSPRHTLVQIVCQDHKGILYDIMRTSKEYNIKISYGRFFTRQRRKCEIDLFIVQADGKKIIDPSKQSALSSRLRMELHRPLKVAVLNRGPDTELLVANPVELSGKGRPLVFHDITIALKMLRICIFSAEIGRHMIRGREWELYKVLLDEGDDRLSVSHKKIEEEVRKKLMGWD